MAQVRKTTESMSAEAVEKATGRPLAEWMGVLDAFDVKSNGHAKAAAFLEAVHGVSPWWAQNLTVTYEQERGLRLPGQRADGRFTVNVSKTIQVPVQAALDAWSSASGWNGWFTTGATMDFREGGSYSNDDQDKGVFKKIRPIGPPNSMGEVARIVFTWENEKHCPGSLVTVQFVEKSETKTQVQITHDKLPDQDGCADMKEGWSWALASLKSFLETGKKIKFDDWKAEQK